MAHKHKHHHHTIDTSHLNRAFMWGIGLNMTFVTAEAIAGFFIGSLGLLADAGHNLSDVISLVLALLAFRLSSVLPTGKYTYGYKKGSILISLVNAFILLIAIAFIIVESIEKIRHPQPTDGEIISMVAGIGILINGVSAWLFYKDRRYDLNIKGAFLHMAADTLVSIGVVISGLAIKYTGIDIIDPIIGIVIAGIILFATWGLLRDSLRLVLDGVPANIDLKRIEHIILDDSRVDCIHHLHIWAISTTQNALTAHIVVKTFEGSAELKHDIRHRLEEAGIQHATFELELPEEDCHDTNCSCNV